MIEENIYSTVPVQTDYVVETKNKLLMILKDNPGKFYKARTLAENCGFNIKGSQVELRKAITDLIMAGHPIVSNALGFGWAQTSNMITMYIESLEYRKKGLQRRIDALTIIENRMLRETKGDPYEKT